uniref:Uncharacterized protein n=1 Tax=viral metagenome TaxID=1070528 RepID=A0A6H1ZAJ3_9ZZZZ
MITIKDVIGIESHKDTLVLKTKSGIDICFQQDAGPNYIDVESYLEDNGQDLCIVVNIKWDDSNIES